MSYKVPLGEQTVPAVNAGFAAYYLCRTDEL
jgi:hypothetical protein